MAETSSVSGQKSESTIPAWAASLPIPQSTPRPIEPLEVAELIKTKTSGVDFLIVDVRRQDFETHFIRSAINLPAQSFHQTLPTLLSLLQRVPLVIYYCGSSNGRGPRCAAWYQDALNAAGITSSEARVLSGGIKGWIVRQETQDLITAI